MIDNNFTIKMKRWLEAESHTEREDILEGATMLLQLTRNQALYNTIVRRPERFVSKIQYELNKFLPMRLAKMTLADVKVLDSEITPVIEAAIAEESSATTDDQTEDMVVLPAATGKRADHDSLPEDIQNIWPSNAERWKKIKEAFNTCSSLDKPCDRFEWLTLMKELWYKYKAEFTRYDEYVIESAEASDESAEQKASEQESAATVDVKAVTNARAYISKNLDKLVESYKASLADGASDKAVTAYRTLAAKVCDRIRILFTYKQVIGDDVRTKLVSGGIDMSVFESVESGAEVSEDASSDENGESDGEGEDSSESAEAAGQ